MLPLRKKIQIILQDPYSSLNPRHTIGEIVMEPMIVHQLFNNTAERKAGSHPFVMGLNESHLSRYPTSSQEVKDNVFL